MSSTSIIISLVSSLCCCTGFVFIFLLIVGVMVLRKRKKKVTAGEALKVGAEVSRAFVRGGKSREQLLAEEDEEEGR